MLPKRWPVMVLSLFVLSSPLLIYAQQPNEFQRIMQRLDQLERENRDLASEVHALRAEIAGARVSTPTPLVAGDVAVNVPAAPIEERMAVQEQRTAELAQTKVEAAQRMPVTLTGMVLFNSFLNSGANGGAQDPLLAAPANNVSGGGASLSQSIIGLRFQGPRVLGGQVRGALDLDLWGGSASSLNHLVRMRVASLEIDWKNSTLTVGQDKPLIAPRDPDSLAQVAFSPLTSAGNLWLWSPQVRFEQRFSWGDNAGVKAQGSVYQTSEPTASASPLYQGTLSSASPGVEGRVEFWSDLRPGMRLEIAPGFHASETRVAGISVPSRLFTLDWMLQPLQKLRLSGAFFNGRNDAGVGGLRQGFTLIRGERFLAVPAVGGWAQLSYSATKRLTFNTYGGQESDSAAALLAGQVTRNFVYAGNAQYRLGTNVLLGLEASQARTSYVGGLFRLVNHYDLALAYLF